MKNIKKFIKKEAELIKCAIIVKAFSFAAYVARHVPGGAADLYTLIETNLDEEAKYFIVDLFYNGEESKTFRKGCKSSGVRYMRKLLKIMQRAYAIFLSLGLLAVSEKVNEQIKKEES